MNECELYLRQGGPISYGAIFIYLYFFILSFFLLIEAFLNLVVFFLIISFFFHCFTNIYFLNFMSIPSKFYYGKGRPPYTCN